MHVPKPRLGDLSICAVDCLHPWPFISCVALLLLSVNDGYERVPFQKSSCPLLRWTNAACFLLLSLSYHGVRTCSTHLVGPSSCLRLALLRLRRETWFQSQSKWQRQLLHSDWMHMRWQ